ncbi:hypothetical protein D3C76_1441610 [compost metagenome]
MDDTHDHHIHFEFVYQIGDHSNWCPHDEMTTIRANAIEVRQLNKRFAQYCTKLLDPVCGAPWFSNKCWRDFIGMQQVQLSVTLQRHCRGSAYDIVVEIEQLLIRTGCVDSGND